MESLTIEQRREILQRRIRKYTARGWLIQHQTDTTAQLVQKKQRGCVTRVLFGIFLLFFPQKDAIVTIEVDEAGKVRERRTKAKA